MSKRTYEEEAKKLAEAIDIAIEAFETHCPADFETHHQEHFINTYRDWKESVLNPEPKFKKLASLKYHINDVFTYFQEGAGPTVERFWKKLDNSGLDYKRENRMRKILDRGKIKGRIEFNYVIDMFVVAQQNGMITKEEAERLNEMLETFEKK